MNNSTKFDKKTMKLINFDRAKKELMNGNQVYMVNLDGSLVEFTGDTDWQTLFFHTLKNGSFAINKKVHKPLYFDKELHIGKRTIGIARTEKGGAFTWVKDVSCQDEQ